jgi:hypothetical protein
MLQRPQPARRTGRVGRRLKALHERSGFQGHLHGDENHGQDDRYSDEQARERGSHRRAAESLADAAVHRPGDHRQHGRPRNTEEKGAKQGEGEQQRQCQHGPGQGRVNALTVHAADHPWMTPIFSPHI